MLAFCAHAPSWWKRVGTCKHLIRIGHLARKQLTWNLRSEWFEETKSTCKPGYGSDFIHVREGVQGCACNLAAQFYNPLDSVFNSLADGAVLIDKRKDEHRFAKTRIKHFHTSCINIRTTVLAIEIQSIMCFFAHSINLGLEHKLVINKSSQVFVHCDQLPLTKINQTSIQNTLH